MTRPRLAVAAAILVAVGVLFAMPLFASEQGAVDECVEESMSMLDETGTVAGVPGVHGPAVVEASFQASRIWSATIDGDPRTAAAREARRVCAAEL